MTSFYENLSDRQLSTLYRKLLPVERSVSMALTELGYTKSMRYATDYPLNWSYTKKAGRFESNVGVDFLDEPGIPKFRVYAAKYLTRGTRTWKARKWISTDISADDLLARAGEQVTQAADQCAQWHEDDLQEIVPDPRAEK